MVVVPVFEVYSGKFYSQSKISNEKRVLEGKALAKEAENDLAIVGKFWDDQHDEEADHTHQGGNGAFIEVLSKSQKIKLKKKNSSDQQKIQASGRSVRSKAGQSNVDK